MEYLDNIMTAIAIIGCIYFVSLAVIPTKKKVEPKKTVIVTPYANVSNKTLIRGKN